VQDDFFASYYAHRPVNATFIGMHAHDERLPDYSGQGAGDAETLLARLAALPPEPLIESQAIDRQLAEGFLEIARWELRSRHFQRGNPCVYTYVPQQAWGRAAAPHLYFLFYHSPAPFDLLVGPHSASTSDRENARLTDLFCENLRRFLDGAPLLYVLDTQRLY